MKMGKPVFIMAMGLLPAVLSSSLAQDALPALGDVRSVVDGARRGAWLQGPASLEVSSVLISAPSSSADGNPWERVQTPSRPPARSIGFYSRGCLQGAVSLPVSGPGYEVMRVSRKRFYGHPRLIEFISSLARQTSAIPKLGTLLVGDLGHPRGGPILKGHASHQTGLDFDLWYLQIPNGTIVTPQDRERLSAVNMVVPVFAGLSKDWDPHEVEILRLAASDASVDRIFVNPVIKREVCRLHGGEAWVSRLRPWFGHDDHSHVRLKCAPGDALCEKQDPVPSGDGCGADLAQWFTQEMLDKAKAPSKPAVMPVLPAACQAVLEE